MEETQPCVTLYELKMRKWESDRKESKWLNCPSMPYHDHLEENISMTCPNSWVFDQVKEKYGAPGHYPHDEEDALKIRIGCSNSIIIISFYIVLTSYFTFKL